MTWAKVRAELERLHLGEFLHKDGITFKELQQKTGLTGKQVSDNAYRLKKENKIEKREDGMFVAL